MGNLMIKLFMYLVSYSCFHNFELQCLWFPCSCGVDDPLPSVASGGCLCETSYCLGYCVLILRHCNF